MDKLTAGEWRMWWWINQWMAWRVDWWVDVMYNISCIPCNVSAAGVHKLRLACHAQNYALHVLRLRRQPPSCLHTNQSIKYALIVQSVHQSDDPYLSDQLIIVQQSITDRATDHRPITEQTVYHSWIHGPSVHKRFADPSTNQRWSKLPINHRGIKY